MKFSLGSDLVIKLVILSFYNNLFKSNLLFKFPSRNVTLPINYYYLSIKRSSLLGLWLLKMTV
jgi:hypothetical protein